MEGRKTGVYSGSSLELLLPGSRNFLGSLSLEYCKNLVKMFISAVHKVRIEYHSVYPLVGIGTQSQPLSRQQVCPSPQEGGGGEKLSCG
jgi:hypothetical protein